MQKTKKKLLLAKDDYDIIMGFIKRGLSTLNFNKKDVWQLEEELRKAKVVDEKEVPADLVRLNSVVKVKEEKQDKVLELKLVTPDKADIRQRKISILSPVGTALLGFRKGEKVNWTVPAGRKVFTILEVANPFQ
jgi:regulator of nucleoside diphosphate kinase